MDGKEIFSKNLSYYMAINHKSRQDISDALGVSYFTVTSWCNGSKYPRIDKVEKLARYFGIKKSDLIEDKPKQLDTAKAALLAEVENMSEEQAALLLAAFQAAKAAK